MIIGNQRTLYEVGMSANAPDWVLWEEHLRNGDHWSSVIRRGTTLRLLAADAGANVSFTCVNADQPLERYNMADTLKAQHTARLTKGHVCYSDMGRILFSIVDDTCGWHDTISGLSNAETVKARYGVKTFQDARNDFYKNAQDSILVELGKHGLGEREVSSCINFFSKVVVDEHGTMKFVPDHAKAGAWVDLRFEMNALVVVSTCQHVLDPDPAYRPRDIDLVAWRSGPAPRNDYCRNLCAENQRGFYNTEALFR
jgi:uncharacterized protein